MILMEQSFRGISTRDTVRLFARPHLLPAFLCGFLFLLTLALQSYRINIAPDLFADEGLYYTVGHNIVAGHGLTELNGQIFVWHPPVYPLIEAVYLKLFGLAGADPISAIYRLRQINILAGALTAGLLFQLGKRIRGQICGAVIALIFAFDPYIQRINRRNMLETVAVMFLVLGIYLYVRRIHSNKRWVTNAMSVGFVFGLAMLTKEVMLFGALIPLLFTCAFRRNQIGRALVTAIVALSVYSLYPLWMLFNGYGSDYIEMKERQLFRFFGRLLEAQTTANSGPPTGGKVSLWDNLSVTLAPYIVSYIVIAVAAAIIVLLAARRLPFAWRADTAEDRLMALWGATAYAMIGISVLFGRGSDQFFYLVIVPATVLVGRALTPMLEYFLWLWWGYWHNDKPRIDPLFKYSQPVHIILLWAGLSGLCWNIDVYTKLFALGQDNSYAVLYHNVNRIIPPGSTLVVGSDLANYLFPDYRISFDREPAAVRHDHARYFILSSKERWGGYNNVTPEFYDWVAANSRLRFEQYGPTFWDLQLFELCPAERCP